MKPLFYLTPLLFAASIATAAGDDEILGRKGSDWIKMFRTHKETKARRASLLALELMGPKSRGVLQSLYEGLEQDPEAEVRREVAMLLGRMGTDARGAPRQLVDTVRRDKSPLVRQAAARSLGGNLRTQSKDYLADIIEMLKDADPNVRAAVTETLRSFDEDAKPALPALEPLVRNKKEERFTRLFGVQIFAIAGLDHPKAGEIFSTIASDSGEHASLREAAIDGLARLGDEKSAATLAPLLSEKDLKLRQSAAAGMSRVGAKAKDAWPSIKAAISDADANVRLQMIRTTGALAAGNAEALATLITCAKKDQATENALAAIQELGSLGRRASSAEAALTEIASNDVRASIRQAATEALKKIQN